MNTAVLDGMLNGSDKIIQQTSVQVYDALISIASVPSQVALQKRNNAASVAAFVSRVKELDKQLTFPSSQQGKLLREAVKSLISEIGREYKTLPHRVFNAHLILAILVQTAHSTKLVTQLHRFMLCRDVAGIHQIADLYRVLALVIMSYLCVYSYTQCSL